MRGSVPNLRVGGCGGCEEGLRSGYDPRCLHRLSCLSGHYKAGVAAALSRTQPVTCDGAWLAGRLSHWLPLINSHGLSAGRSGADSWMRRSGMPWYSVRAAKGGLGACGLLQFLHVGLQRLHVHNAYSMAVPVSMSTWVQLCRGVARKSGSPEIMKLN